MNESGSDNNQLLKETYNISQEQYIEFNQMFFDDYLKNKSKRSYIVSSAMIIMSVILGLQTILAKRYDEYFLDFVILFVFVAGVYNIIFYKKIFPKSLIKKAKQVYLETRFSKGDITVEIFDGYLEERYNNEGIIKERLEDIEKVYQNNQLLALLFKDQQIVIIDKSKVSDKFIERIIEIKKER